MTWWRRLLKREQIERQLDSELRFHLEQQIAEHLRAGIGEQEAHRAARLQLGGMEQLKEECRDAGGTRWVETLIQDLRFALRTLMKSRDFGVVAVATIALAIGANTAVFSVLNTVLLKPLPYRDADRIVQFEDIYAGIKSPVVGPKEFNIWRQKTTVFQDISAHWLDHMNLSGGPNAELVSAALVTADFFRLYGMRALHGRTFAPEEDTPGGRHVAVLGNELWTRRFAADPGIVGKTISLAGVPYVVVGVLAPFDAEGFDERPGVWIPFQINPDNNQKDGRLCSVTGRLKPGATLSMAKAELQLVTGEYRRAFPGLMRPKDGFTLEPLRDAMVGDVRLSLLILAGAVAFVLLIACANVANLLLARAAGRKREMTIRVAIGAGRWRIIRQLLTESVVLSLAGGAAGLALGSAGIRAILRLLPGTPLGAASKAVIPRIGEAGAAVALDWRVLAFTTLVSLLTGVFFGVIPALQISRADLNSPLKEASGRSGTGFRQNKAISMLVICEMTLALILLTGAALLIRTSVALQAVNPGFDSHNVLTMQMSLAGASFGQQPALDQLVRDGIRRIGALPGVEIAASSCCLPLETVWQLPYIVAGRPLNGRFHGFAGWTFTSPGYFEALHITVLRGRAFTARDDAKGPGVVIINQALARLGWPNGDPLNDRLLIGRTMGPEYDKEPVRQIIGIVGDIRDIALNREPRPAMYVSIAQVSGSVQSLVLPHLPIAWIVRTRLKPKSLGLAVQNELRKASGGLPIARVRPMDEVASQSTARTQFQMALMAIFAGSALLLAAIGIYGLITHSVQQRTQEIGIRLALGAKPSVVRKMVVFQGMGLALIGIAIGIVGAFGVTRLLAGFLFGVQARDPITFVVVPVLLSAVALLAVSIPARRATRINPVDALRSE